MTEGPFTHSFTPDIDPDQTAPAQLRRLLDAGMVPDDAILEVAWLDFTQHDYGMVITIRSRHA